MRTDAGQERLTYTASGMVTNTAARLCQLATHGDIYLSETTAHLVRHRFMLDEPAMSWSRISAGRYECINCHKSGCRCTRIDTRGCAWLCSHCFLNSCEEYPCLASS